MRFAIVKSAAELGERAFYEIKRVLDAKPDAKRRLTALESALI